MKSSSSIKAKRIWINSIGVVKNGIKDLKSRDWENVVSKVIVYPKYEPALEGIEESSHVHILYYLHKLPKNERNLLKVHPMRRRDMPLVGVFAVRSACRPNPIGLSLVELILRKNNVLVVKGLDAIDGSPIIDIKPFNPKMDCVKKFKVPKWLEKIIKEK
ncbi:MAG: tRNA (N6-threonylcarbamoyladenosine(37)-N6)-methyltransferase TrmO [Candidatus Bathyarchaeia archaeon]